MRNFLLRLLQIFIPTHKARKAFRNKFFSYSAKISADKKHNNICIPKNRKINLEIIGKNNNIFIDKDIDINSEINIKIVGDNNIINIKKSNLRINLVMGSEDNRAIFNSNFMFGYSSVWHGIFVMMDNNTSIEIGDDCMFSNNIEFRCTDDHTILDKNNNVINLAKSIVIGNHVWLGKNVTILKNSQISDGSIVGAYAVVAKKFTQPNVVIVGNPARIVKENIHWDGARPDLYKAKKEEAEKC